MPAHLADVTQFWSLSGGGVRRYLTAKRRWLARHTVWCHSLVVPGDGKGGTLPSVPLPFSQGYRWPYSRAGSARRIVDLQPDLIECGDPLAAFSAAARAANRLRVPLVAFAHCDLPAMAARFGGATAERLAAAYLRRIYGRCELVLAPSRHTRARLHDYGVERVRVQPLGVDTSIFRPQAPAIDWRAQLNLPHATRVLVYAGRFAPEKNLHVLTEAVRRLGPAYALIAIGAGPTPPAGPQVIALPFRRDTAQLAAAINGADVFVHAGDAETFGLGALEALACGVPVVACAAAAVTEMIDDRVGAAVAWTVPAKRADQFAQAISAVCERGRESYATPARARALCYDWKPVFGQLFGRYVRLMAQNGRGAQATCAPREAHDIAVRHAA